MPIIRRKPRGSRPYCQWCAQDLHELAVGIKGAYEAVVATKPEEYPEKFLNLDPQERKERKVLWEFNGNLNFVSVITIILVVYEGLGH